MILITEESEDYELLDSGMGEKLERFGQLILHRPDPQVLWPKSLSEDEWKKADAVFVRAGKVGKWLNRQGRSLDQSQSFGLGQVTLEDLTFNLRLLPSKHVGVFPEQSVHWKWLTRIIKTQTTQGNPVYVLNLFGYTGGASLACAKAGAGVTHVDASEFAVDLAKENSKLSKLEDKPIRFIVDDVRKFVEREIKRGKKYDVVLIDAPVYGKGAKGETWNIEKDLMPLVSRVKNVLSNEPLAIILNGYSSGYSHITYAQILSTITSSLKGLNRQGRSPDQNVSFGLGQVSSGELAISESSSGRLLPSGIFARWESQK